MKTGKVWLVGAGPGDDGLLTVKGRNVLAQAEAVVYDALVGAGVLAWIPPEIRCIFVGKRSGCHAMTQEEINQCLVSLAAEGKKVVRLKGGDPFLFGRGGEEIEALAAHDIPFEVVPGVPSALAVPAYCGIPVTHRDYCSSVHIITGHKKRGESLSLDFEALCRLGGTLVFLMGVSSLPDICQGLRQAGMDENMPAALLSRGTTAYQKKIVATVKTLPAQAECQKPVTPAILVVGQVCRLSGVMDWYEKLPLSGTRVIVTRPRDRSRKLAEPLRQLGAQVLEIPSIGIVPEKSNFLLGQALEQLGDYQWLVFTSPSGVEIFWEECRNRKIDIRQLAGIHIAVIGPGTRERLEQKGIFADLMPEIYCGGQLGKCLAGQVKEGQRILIPRAKEGSAELIRELKKGPNVQIDDIAVYDTLSVPLVCPQLGQELRETEHLIVAFTSASTVRGFMEELEEKAGNTVDIRQLKAACIGEQTRQEAKRFHLDAYAAREATVESLVELIMELAHRVSSTV